MTENPLGYEKISKLLKNFAVPSIVAISRIRPIRLGRIELCMTP